jgi:hypothetical protein
VTPSTREFKAGQRGATVFGGFLILLMVAAVVLVIMKVTPAYVENYNIKRVLNDMAQDSEVTKMTSFQVRQTLTERLRVSGIHDRKSKKINVKRQGRETNIEIRYVVKKHLVANIDLLISFHDTATVLHR